METRIQNENTLDALESRIANSLPRGCEIVVGVSGGRDSMALLNALARLREKIKSLSVVHVNHHLRGIESDEDELFVCAEAKSRNLDVLTVAKPIVGRANIQHRARAARFQAFQAILSQKPDAYLALAHHREDQAELFFIRLLQGASTTALKGMQWINHARILRPMLEVTRAQVERYVATHGVSYREDSSNAKRDYLRNRVRQEIIPALNRVEPNWQGPFHRSLGLLAEEDHFLDRLVDDLEQRCVNREADAVKVTLQPFRQADRILRYRLIKRIAGYINAPRLSTAHVAEMDQIMLRSQGSEFHQVTKRCFCLREFDHVELRPGGGLEQPMIDCKLPLGAINLSIPIVRSSVVLRVESCFNTNTVGESDAIPRLRLRRDDLSAPRIRGWHPGDRLSYAGGTKKIAKLFTDEKIPLSEKRRSLVLENGGDVVAVFSPSLYKQGGVIDDRYRSQANGRDDLIFYWEGTEGEK